jgi:hypothetical protein
MKSFHCHYCGMPVFFENHRGVKCDPTLGFLPDRREINALAATPDGRWRRAAGQSGNDCYRACPNGAEHRVCLIEKNRERPSWPVLVHTPKQAGQGMTAPPHRMSFLSSSPT